MAPTNPRPGRRGGAVVAALLALAAPSVGCRADAAPDAAIGQADLVVGLAELPDHVAVFDDRLELDARVRPQLEESRVLDKIDAYARAADKTSVEPVFFIGGRQKGALEPDGSIRPSARNPMGYLRRALSWEEGPTGDVVVRTARADMAEAVEELKKTGYLPLGADTSDVSLRSNTNGVDTDSGFGNSDKRWRIPVGPSGSLAIDLSGKTLWERAAITGGTARLALRQGQIRLEPVVDLHLRVERFVPRSAEATITTGIDGALELEAVADGAFDDLREGTLYERSSGTQVAGLPVSLSVTVRYACEVASSGGGAASAGTTVKGTIRAGASLEGTRLDGIMEPSAFALSRLGPELDSRVNVQGVCHVTSTLDVHLFDEAGPRASVDLVVRLSADGRNAELAGGARASLVGAVDATAGGSFRAFGLTIADIRAPAYHFERELYSGEITLGRGGER